MLYTILNYTYTQVEINIFCINRSSIFENLESFSARDGFGLTSGGDTITGITVVEVLATPKKWKLTVNQKAEIELES